MIIFRKGGKHDILCLAAFCIDDFDENGIINAKNFILTILG